MSKHIVMVVNSDILLMWKSISLSLHILPAFKIFKLSSTHCNLFSSVITFYKIKLKHKLTGIWKSQAYALIWISVLLPFFSRKILQLPTFAHFRQKNNATFEISMMKSLSRYHQYFGNLDSELCQWLWQRHSKKPSDPGIKLRGALESYLKE